MLSALLSGGLTGVIGSVVTNISDYFEERRKNKHELEMRNKDIEEMQKEYDNRKEIAKQEQNAEMRSKSYDHDSRSYSKGLDVKSVWLKSLLVLNDFIRGLVRPALTIFLIWLVWDTRMEVQMVIDNAGLEALSPQQAIGIYTSIIEMILYLASTAVTWWFGTSPKRKKKE